MQLWKACEAAYTPHLSDINVRAGATVQGSGDTGFSKNLKELQSKSQAAFPTIFVGKWRGCS